MLKKLIIWLASFILVSSTAPTISKLVLSKRSVNNNYSYKNDSYWPIYNDLQHKGNFVKFNDNLGVFNDNEYQKTYFVSKDGQFTELKLNGQSVTGTFTSFNWDEGVFVTSLATYFLSYDGQFTELKLNGQSVIGVFTNFNWYEGVFVTSLATYFLHEDGIFKELKVKGIYDWPISITGTAKRMNDNTCVYLSNEGTFFFR